MQIRYGFRVNLCWSSLCLTCSRAGFSTLMELCQPVLEFLVFKMQPCRILYLNGVCLRSSFLMGTDMGYSLVWPYFCFCSEDLPLGLKNSVMF